MTAPAQDAVAVRRRATGREHSAAVLLARALGWVLVRLLFSTRLIGREHVPAHGAVLLAGNHTGFVDGPLVFVAAPRPAVFLVKSELFVGVLARLLGWCGQVPVHRGRPDRAALQQALAALARGRPVGVFPEGTRGSGQLESVQHGIAYLAVRSGCPIVPVACLGTAAAMPQGRRLPRWRAPVTIVFGAPFTVQVTGDPRSRRVVADAAEQIRTHLRDHLVAAQAAANIPEQP